MGPVLQGLHLCRTFSGGGRNRLSAVDDVTLSLFPGEKLALIGESGSGKTTVVRLLTRLLDVTSGTVLLDGEDITRYRPRQMRPLYRKMQMVFQNPVSSFDPRRTLGDGASEGLRNAGLDRQTERTAQLFERCGLSTELLHRYPHEVSGGQCQRAAIARAVAVEPEILILDEATSALDMTVQAEILALLETIQRERHMACLFISHDIALVQQFCDRVLVMYHGDIVEQGAPDAVIYHPQNDYTKRLIDSVL